MSKKTLFPAIAIALVAAYLFWWFSTPQVLKRRSSDLIDCVRMEEGTGRVQRAFKADDLRDIITEHVTVTYPQMRSTFNHKYAINTPITLEENQAKSALLYLSELAEWITVENETIEVLEHNDTHAKVKVSFTLSAKLKGKPEQTADLKGIFSFEYKDNRWLVSEATFD